MTAKKEEPQKGGRPLAYSKEDLLAIVTKMRPYLRAGLSLQKACIGAEIQRNVVYEYMERYSWFGDMIRAEQKYMAITVSQTNAMLVGQIRQKIQHNQEITDGMKKGKLVRITHDELEFLKWYSSTAQTTKEEFSPRADVNVVDPELEIQRLKKLFNGEPIIEGEEVSPPERVEEGEIMPDQKALEDGEFLDGDV